MIIFFSTGDVLEIGVQWSVLMKDIPSFERYMAQLKCYYYDYRQVDKLVSCDLHVAFCLDLSK